MKRLIRAAISTKPQVIVETPYNTYEFDSEEEAQEFEEYVQADPDYDDPDLGDIVEHCFFLNKGHE